MEHLDSPSLFTRRRRFQQRPESSSKQKRTTTNANGSHGARPQKHRSLLRGCLRKIWPIVIIIIVSLSLRTSIFVPLCSMMIEYTTIGRSSRRQTQRFYYDYNYYASSSTRQPQQPPRQVFFSSHDVPNDIPHHHDHMYEDHRDAYLHPIPHVLDPDYNGLQIKPIGRLSSKTLFERTIIIRDDRRAYESYRRHILNQIEKQDDGHSHEYYYPYDDVDFHKQTCWRPKWSYIIHPICNTFHEMIHYDRMPETNQNNNGQSFDVRYLAHGYYRDTFGFKPILLRANHPSPPKDIEIVVKSLRYKHEPHRRNLLKVYNEAILMDTLQASPVTANTYGHCATSIIMERGHEIAPHIVPFVPQYQPIEPGRISQTDLDPLQQKDVHPFNDRYFPRLEKKLDVAIAISESIAELHGLPLGVTTNDDLALEQWLVPMDGRAPAMLNDFNNAVVMSWNTQEQSYCPYYARFPGTFKAPEEYRGDYVDESADIWPLGNILFTLLTGLYLYYNETDEKTIQQLTLQGGPYIDPRYRTRSFIEQRMVSIMEQCHKVKPSQRVSVFEVVRYLRKTKEMHQARMSSKAKTISSPWKNVTL